MFCNWWITALENKLIHITYYILICVLHMIEKLHTLLFQILSNLLGKQYDSEGKCSCHRILMACLLSSESRSWRSITCFPNLFSVLLMCAITYSYAYTHHLNKHNNNKYSIYKKKWKYLPILYVHVKYKEIQEESFVLSITYL